jgi:membrane associated rhomboid family serine protease
MFLLQQAFPRIDTYLALNVITMRYGHWVWELVTYMFVHGSWSHIIFNMLALFIFGTVVERQMGSKEFLLFYFSTGILAGLFSLVLYWLTGLYHVFLIGASGAIFAVQLAYAVINPNSRVLIWGIIPMRAPVMVVGFTLIELASQVFGFNSGVAHLTHLAGFGFGWLYFLARFGVNPIKVWRGK